MSDNANDAGQAGTQVPESTPATTVNTVDALPEFAQKMISDLRSEAAKHRTAKGEAVEATKSAVTTEYEAKLAESNTAHEETKATLASVNLELAKLKAAVGAKIPLDKLEAFAELLQGSNADELAAHADKLKKTFGVGAAVDPSQGRGSGDSGAGIDFASYVLSKLDK